MFIAFTRLLGALALGLLVLCAAPARAADDREALAGLKEGKVAFDLRDGDPKVLLLKLDNIEDARRSLVDAGVAPRFVLAFRGPASRLVQTNPDKIKPEDREFAAKVATRLKEMSQARGVERVEQCELAMRHQDVKAEWLLPEVRLVGNGFVSLLAYQARGYAYIAP